MAPPNSNLIVILATASLLLTSCMIVVVAILTVRGNIQAVLDTIDDSDGEVPRAGRVKRFRK